MADVLADWSSTGSATGAFTMGSGTPPEVAEFNPRGVGSPVWNGRTLSLAQSFVLPAQGFQKNTFQRTGFQARGSLGSNETAFISRSVVSADLTASPSATVLFDGGNIMRSSGVATATFAGQQVLAGTWTVAAVSAPAFRGVRGLVVIGTWTAAGVTVPNLRPIQTLTAAQTLNGVSQSVMLDVVTDGYIATQTLDGVTQSVSLDNKLYSLTDRIRLKAVPITSATAYRIQPAP